MEILEKLLTTQNIVEGGAVIISLVLILLIFKLILFMRDCSVSNQRNVDLFRETVNHNQDKIKDALNVLSEHISDQTEIFKQLINKQ